MEQCKKGDHVVLIDNFGQSFVGVVKSVNHDLGRVVLSEVVQLPERKIITGYRNFDKNEINEIRKCETDETENDVVEGAEEQEQEEPKSTLLEPGLSEVQNLPSDYCYIQDSGASFQSAIASLKSCHKVGLHAKDTSKGRCDRASVVAVSTPSKVFVFDLQALEDDVVQEGLKEILESPATIKVVHDCRLLSDCLKHKHLIHLNRVRDVEAEDIMLVYQERKTMRKHRRPLEYLIKVHLGVDVPDLEALAGTWDHRPLSTTHLESLAALTSLLLPLQEAIQQKYLQRLLDASAIYNTHVRSLDLFEFLLQDPEKTLRNEMIKLVVPQTQVRAGCSKTKLDVLQGST